MSDFLTRLAERQLTDVRGVTPRLPPRFAPVPALEVEPDSVPRWPFRDAREPIAQTEGVDAGAHDADKVTDIVAPSVDVEPVRLRSAQEPQEAEANYATAGRQLAAASEKHAAEPARASPRVETTEQLKPLWPRAVELSPTTAAPLSAEVTTTRHEREILASPLSRPRSAPQPLVLHKAREPEPAERPLLATEPRSGVDREPPIVKITIGRVEVRAVMPPQPARERRALAARNAMSLEEYLEHRHAGRR